jgi:hypothetical protein
MDGCSRALLESAVARRFIEAYLGRNDRLERVFYFYFPLPPPDLVVRELRKFGATVCSQPELKHFTKIRFP